MRTGSRLRAAVTVMTVAGLVGLALSPAHATATTAPAKEAVAVGGGGAVVSDTVEATDAGLAVLRTGGTAADAVVTVAATLGVTDPYVAGIGGGGYLVYYDGRTHRVSTIDGRETAPASVGTGLFLDAATGRPLSFPTAVTSGLSVGVPGTLMTWQQALDRWGRFRFAEDLRPAEQVADRGFPVTATLREQTRENAARFAQFSSTSTAFLPDGQLPEVGSTMRNPDLAATYRQIGREGVGALYGGAIGLDVVRTVQNLPLAPGATLRPRPGLMQLPDLSGYHAAFIAPTHVTYRGYDVYGMAPSSSGGSTAGEALNMLNTFDRRGQSRVQALHHYLEASRLAFADRNRYVGDPRYTAVPLAQLLSPQFGQQRACLIAPGRALTSPVAPGDPFAGSGGCTPAEPTDAWQVDEGTNTNHFVVADRWGNVASYTNTIEELGGSGIVVPHRGFLLNNELTDFDFTPLSPGTPDPNLPAGGKRPRSSMAPTIVLRDGQPWLAIGSPGGATIITTVLQILLNRIDFGRSLPDAIAAPRASQRNSATTQVEPAFLADPAVPALAQLGQKFAVSTTSPRDPAIAVPPDIGVAAGLEFLGHGRVVAAGEPARRGGRAGVVNAGR
jgi:gamma-glutamyltranspeptidase / glutathione hydrolase